MSNFSLFRESDVLEWETSIWNDLCQICICTASGGLPSYTVFCQSWISQIYSIKQRWWIKLHPNDPYSEWPQLWKYSRTHFEKNNKTTEFPFNVLHLALNILSICLKEPVHYFLFLRFWYHSVASHYLNIKTDGVSL